MMLREQTKTGLKMVLVVGMIERLFKLSKSSGIVRNAVLESAAVKSITYALFTETRIR